MARKKQSTPLKRVPSDFTHGVPDQAELSRDKANGHANGNTSANGHTAGTVQAALAPVLSEEKAGLTQLVVCVGGIYASL
jgi:hypothetical protein